MPGLFLSGSTCLCKEGRGFYLKFSDECAECHPYCLECFDNTTTICPRCTPSVAIYQSAPNQCSCRDIGPFYENEDHNICLRIEVIYIYIYIIYYIYSMPQIL